MYMCKSTCMYPNAPLTPRPHDHVKQHQTQRQPQQNLTTKRNTGTQPQLRPQPERKPRTALRPRPSSRPKTHTSHLQTCKTIATTNAKHRRAAMRVNLVTPGAGHTRKRTRTPLVASDSQAMLVVGWWSSARQLCLRK